MSRDERDGGDGGRLYLTGDLAVAAPDGCLFLVGRKDDQVKVRGHRILTSEIEKATLQHPSITQAAVTTFQDGTGNLRLACYYETRDGRGLGPRALRSFLHRRLPYYMLPNTLTPVRRLPLTGSGKVDRRALPVPPTDAQAGDTKRRRARLDERADFLAAIWRQVLEIPTLGLDDDFFELGGDSYLALVLVLEIEQRVGVELDLGDVFAAPTLRNMVDLLESGRNGEGRTVVPLRAGGEAPPLICLNGVDVYRELAAHLGGEQPVVSMIVPLDPGSSRQRGAAGSQLPGVNEVATSYCDLIQTYQGSGPYRLAGLSAGGIIAMEVARMLQSRGERVELVCLFDTILPASRSRIWSRWILRRLRMVATGDWRQLLDRVLWRLQGFEYGRRFSRWLHRGTARELQAARHFFRRKITRGYCGPQTPLDARVVLFRADGDEAAQPDSRVSPDNGWSRYLGSNLAIHNIPGNHGNILKAPRVRAVADRVQEYL